MRRDEWGSDDPRRVAGPDELPSDHPKRPRDETAPLFEEQGCFHHTAEECEAIWAQRRVPDPAQQAELERAMALVQRTAAVLGGGVLQVTARSVGLGACSVQELFDSEFKKP
jgi:hypothetical protein